MSRRLLRRLAAGLAATGLFVSLSAPSPATQVVAANGTMILDANGKLSGAGDNNLGQLGLGDPFSRRMFCDLPDPGTWDRLWVGTGCTFARKTDGSLWACGYGLQLGIGSNLASVRSFTQVGAETDWSEVALGERHTILLKTDGSLWSCGMGTQGQLGLESGSSYKNLPTRIGAASDWKRIATDQVHNIAIKTDGSLWAWGTNSSGQLGDGTTTPRNVPSRIGTLVGWKLAAAGKSHSLAIREDGSLWAWGANAAGQLGTNSTVASSVPVRVGTGNNWSAVSAGDSHSLALMTDGSCWVWGGNANGQLGLGDTLNRTSPVRLGVESDWQSIEAGLSHSAAVRAGGSVWVWGGNGNWQLGESARADRLVPAMITRYERPDVALSVENYPSGDSSLAIEGRSSFAFQRTAEGLPLTANFHLYNLGASPLNVSELRLDSGFSTALAAPVTLAAGAACLLPVVLDCSRTGDLSGHLTIVSNDADEGEFEVAMTGSVLSHQNDGDGDGLDDAAEWKLSQFGFRWNSADPILVNTLKTEAHRAGLYSESQLRDQQPGSPLLRRGPATGRASLVLRLEQSGDPGAFFTSDSSGSKIDAAGRLLVPLPRTAAREFYRFAIETSPATP